MTREELMEDVNIGDVVKLRTDASERPFEGKIVDFGISGLKISLIGIDKSKRVTYERIIEYDIEEKTDDLKNDNQEEVLQNQELVETIKDETHKDNQEKIEISGSDDGSSERLPPEKSNNIASNEAANKMDITIENLKKCGNSYFDTVDQPKVKDIKEIAKMTDDSSLRKEINAISDSLDYAINQNHENSPADYKIQENIGKIKRLIRNYPHSKIPNDLLGAVYFRLKCDGLAMEAYENGDDNESAFVIAERYNSEEKKIMFASRHFVIDRTANAYIYLYLLNYMFTSNDYSLCTKITTQNLCNDKLRAYHTFTRGILLLNNIEYNKMLNFDISEDALEDLLKIFRKKIISTKMELVKFLPEKKSHLISQHNILDIRSLDECPIFSAAERARMEEKNLLKAEKLYIQAIENGERPGSAVANLYQILITQRRYKDCAMFLGKYGSKYMREEAYKNLKKQFFIVAPQMRQEISRYEKEDDFIIDYFVLAQKAEIEEKDLQKSITYYKKAINEKKRLSSAIPNLVSIYSRLEMFSEALELLNKDGKNIMDKNAYLNLKQNILIKAKDKRYKKEIDETFNKLMEIATSIERKTEVAAAKAKLLLQIEEYDEAIKIYKFCLENCNNKNYSKEKKNRQKIYVLNGLCNTYIHKNEIDMAQNYAVKILELDSSNEFAKLILTGNISEDADLMEENIGIIHIIEYIQNYIDGLSLDSEIKLKNLLEDGVFVGTQERAASILHSIMDPRNRSVNEEAKSNQYLAGAKLIHQILDRDEDIDTSKFNEQRFLYFVAAGTCSYANSRLYRNELADNENLDVARYFYTQPITIFNDSKKLHSSWAVATIRYIQTYFDPVEKIRKDRDSIYQRCRDHNACISEIKKIMQNPIRAEINNFTIGMIELLTYNTRIKKEVLGFINANVFQGKILDVLARILGKEVPDIMLIKDLEYVWDSAAKSYYAQRRNFLRLISETIDSLFAVGQLQENLERLKTNTFNGLLNNTDKEYVKNLYEIFNNISRYNEIGEFDYKADTLKAADEARKILVEKINEYPTYLSYEKLLPQIEQIQIKIFKESISLYGDSEPQLSVVLSGECSFEPDKMIVRVPIAYTNKSNVQNADNVQMIVRGEGVENIEDTMLSRDLWIGDGRAKEKMLIFKISDKILEEKVFSLEISITYQYKKNMAETEDGSADFVLSVPLYNDSIFEPIENKFKIISGGDPVYDESMFYGRDKDISSIIRQIKGASLENKSGKCLVLYGQTRTGKTSILHHLQVRLREQGEENIIIDMGSLGRLGLAGNNITEFLYEILRTLDKEIKKHHEELAAIIKDRKVEIDAKSLLKNPDQSQLRFNEIFEDVYDIIREQEKPYHIILMIDEFTYIYDWIRQGTMTDRIMKFWKAFMQTYNVFAIIIGQDHMMQFIADQRFTNDFGIMELMKVSYLSRDDAQKLMDEPILYLNENGEKISRYKEGALDRLYELTSGSAFLIGKLCAGLVEYLNDTRSVFITRAHIDDYIEKLLPSFDQINFEPQYRDLSEIGESSSIIKKNKAMLKKIAMFSNKKEYTQVEAVVQSDEDRDILEKLEQRDVVIIKNGDRCKIKVALYKEWLRLGAM